MSKKGFIVSIFITFLSIAAFSKGSAEADYSTAKNLIESSKNSDALENILDVMENKKESLEAGIALARKTMKNQGEFKEKFEELIELLKNDPNNNEDRIALISSMEALEADIDPRLKDFLDKVKVSSFYAIYRIKFNEIMDEGIALIRQQKYNEASNTFLKGFSIYDGSIVEETENTNRLVKEQLDAVKADVKKYESSYSKFTAYIENYASKSFSSSTVTLEKELADLETSVFELKLIISSILKSGSILKKIYLDELKKHIDSEESLLTFAYRLTLGRDSAKYYEGIEGAMTAGIFEPLFSLVDQHWEEIKKLWFKSCDTFDFENDLPIQKDISVIDFHLKSLSGIYSLINARSDSRFAKTLNPQDKKRASIAELNNIINSTKNYYSRFLVLRNEIELIPSSYSGSSDELRKSENTKIKKLQTQIEEVEAMLGFVKQLSGSALAHKENDLFQEEESLQAKYDLFLNNLNKTRLVCYEEVTLINNKSAKAALAESKKRHENFRDYLIQKNIDKAVDISPSEARQELIGLKQIINLDIRFLKKFIKDTDASIAGLSQTIEENKNDIEKTIISLENLSGSINEDLAKAEAVRLKIQLAKNEADLRYEEAIKNLKTGNFSAARRSIELSRTKTNDALALEENSEYRKETDERLEKLGKEINDAENAVVVKDVREYLEKAKKDYFNTDFRRSEETLILAKNRWAVTHIDPNEEIENWLGIVSTAGTLKTGRNIPVSAPLYPQMIQLLNNSNQLYLEAEQKIKEGQRNSALQNLNQAKDNIRKVLLIFPYNEIAGQLNLKIDKLIDPVNFNEQFRRKVAAIRSGYKSNSQKAYSDLLDLYGIDKNFPGLAALKNEVEIYLGLKLPPPDLKAIADSAALTKSAQAIYKSGDRLLFTVAVQQLDTAIKLDPKNVAAIQLKDSIQMAMGGAAAVVLSAADESTYQQAVSELQKGNKVIAAALVEQLMRSPNARNSAKVRELKKRIDALL